MKQFIKWLCQGKNTKKWHYSYYLVTLILFSFLANNYDRKNFNIRRYKKKHDVGTLSDYDCLKNHIMNLGTISTEIEGRIVVSKCILCIFLRIHSTYIFFLDFDDSDVTTEKTSSTTSDNSACPQNSISLLVVMLVFLLQKM